MDDRKDYIDLRESAQGNGPPPVPPVPVYTPPARKNNGLIIAVVVLSSLLLLAVISIPVMSFALFRNVATTGTQTQFATIDAGSFSRDIEVWARQFETDVEDWAMDFGDQMIAWAERFGGIDVSSYPDGFTTFTEIRDSQYIPFFISVEAHGMFYDIVDIDLGASNDVRIMSHGGEFLEFSGSRGFIQSNDWATGVVSIHSDDQLNGGTLTVRVPHDWQGTINIITAGDITMSDQLYEGTIVNQMSVR